MAKSPKGDDKKYDNPIFEYDASRRKTTKFGKGDVQYVEPADYPSEADFKKTPVKGELTLEKVYGYKGCTNNARQNLYVRDNLLIYYIAALGIINDTNDGSQKFFDLHNDDVTCLCVDPREGSTIAVTGQKDPKDEPGQGKDYPKIWVWDYKTLEGLCLIDDVCWGQVNRLQISPVTGFLYVLCGDKDQTLKVYNLDECLKKVKGKKKKKIVSKEVELLAVSSQNTKKIGFLINPVKNKDYVDELIIYCNQKLQHVIVTDNPKKKGTLQAKFRAVSVGNLNKAGEKAFLCAEFIPDGSGKYLVGATSGSVYLCEGPKAINQQKKLFKAKDASVFGLCFDKNDGKVYLASDNKVKQINGFTVKVAEKGAFLTNCYESGPLSVDGSDFVFNTRTLAFQDGKIIVGSRSNQIASFDLESKKGTLLVDGHDGQVHAVCSHPSEDIFITGGWDKALKVWNAEQHKCVATYEFYGKKDPYVWQRKQDGNDGKDDNNNDDEKKWADETYQLVCADWDSSAELVAMGTETSAVFIFQFQSDPVRLNLLHAFKIPPKKKGGEVEPVSRVQFNKDATQLAVSHMDSNIYVYNLTYDKDAKSIKITKFGKPAPNRAAPSHLQWSEDGTMVRALTRDYEIATFFVEKEAKKVTRCIKLTNPDKFKWFGDPLLTGWETKGCLQKEMDGTDINDLSVTSDLKLVAVGDDFGHVRLHNYPVVLPEPNLCYSGHAEHVSGVKFLGNDHYLITGGGADFAIMQWKLQKK